MLRLFKHEVSNYLTNMGKIHFYNHFTNQLINYICLLEKPEFTQDIVDTQIFEF